MYQCPQLAQTLGIICRSYVIKPFKITQCLREKNKHTCCSNSDTKHSERDQGLGQLPEEAFNRATDSIRIAESLISRKIRRPTYMEGKNKHQKLYVNGDLALIEYLTNHRNICDRARYTVYLVNQLGVLVGDYISTLRPSYTSLPQ